MILGSKPLIRRRREPDTWVDGVRIPGTSTDAGFTGSVQFLRGRDRESLPEGVRTVDGRRLYTESRGFFRTEDQHVDPPLPGDQVIDGALVYQVYHVDSDHPLIPHDRVFVTRIPEKEAP